MQYVIALLIGYACGNFLTADVVCRHVVHKSVFDVGIGNPGMANVGHELGTKWALVVLAGDILKFVLGMSLTWIFFGHTLPLMLVSGLGVTCGHNFPIWHHFKGGKGVTTTCSTIIFSDPVWGTIASLIGFATVLGSEYLCVGALVIPVSYLIILLIRGTDVLSLLAALALSLIMLEEHLPAILEIKSGTTPKAHIALTVKSKFHR